MRNQQNSSKKTPGEIKLSEEKIFWTGNEMTARAAIVAGCRFFAGYPITPSSEIAAFMARLLPKHGGSFIQMEDEIAAMGAIIGGSLAGAKSMTATSGPGYSLKQEHIGYACMAEVPCVVINVMRGGPSTGLPTAPAQSDLMQAKWGTHGDHTAVAIAPSYLKEVYLETIRAFNISEKYRTPVTVLLDEILGHMSEGVVLPKDDEIDIFNRVKPTVPPEEYYPFDTAFGDVPPMASYFEGYRFHVTGLNHDKTGFPTTVPEVCHDDAVRMLRKIDANVKDIEKYDEFMMQDADIAVVSFGTTARAAKVAVIEARKQGIRAGLFRPITVWPFPTEALREYNYKVRTAVVPEMNLGQMRLEVERTFGPQTPVHGVNAVGGAPIEPEPIIQKIKEVNK
jgi:2-oxoglutarate ferredoxin oxidoreductase subunit alpha